MRPAEPMRLTPLFRSYLWGGRRLESSLGKAIPADGIWAESWEVVDHGEDQSVVSGGPWDGWTLGKLVEAFPKEMLGSWSRWITFPLLLKYLDCQRVLSVQVHPDDEYGSRMPTPDLGKTEAWYVIDAEPGATIYAGLKAGVDRDGLLAAIEAGETESVLHQLQPAVGDCIFIPAGTVHALGAGLIVAEIQQASDTTFRLFDWNRVDANGVARPLHIQQALDVIDYERGPVAQVSRPNNTGPEPYCLVECDKFFLEEFASVEGYDLPHDGHFRILTVPRGRGRLVSDQGTYVLRTGDSLLVPAVHGDCRLELEPASTALIAGVP